jgi:hypothetical protein
LRTANRHARNIFDSYFKVGSTTAEPVEKTTSHSSASPQTRSPRASAPSVSKAIFTQAQAQAERVARSGGAETGVVGTATMERFEAKLEHLQQQQEEMMGMLQQLLAVSKHG